MTAMKYCPFCGEEHDLTVVTSLMPQLPEQHGAAVWCEHCAARGGCFYEETVEEAVLSAINNWNECHRQNAVIARILREWNTLMHRLGL